MSSEAEQFVLSVPAPEGDEARLDLSQRVRHLALMQVTKNGTIIPTCEEDRDLMIKMLDGGDKVALSKMKIKSENDRAQADNKLALAMTEIMDKMNFGQKPTPEVIDGDYNRIPGVDLSVIGHVQPVPGQLDQTTHDLTYAELEAAHSRHRNG